MSSQVSVMGRLKRMNHCVSLAGLLQSMIIDDGGEENSHLEFDHLRGSNNYLDAIPLRRSAFLYILERPSIEITSSFSLQLLRARFAFLL